ncbi:hypothetical protein KAW96_00450 [candidate division WOR-3 bacterium]|nr:hypothetical protein [candidate division WOR-3 bacterium]
MPAERKKLISEKTPTWTAEEEIRLIKEYNQGKTINELAEIFQRSPDAIRSRLEKLAIL